MRNNPRNNIEQIILRRSIVLDFLNEEYCLNGDISVSHVMNALAAQNVHATVAIVRQDITMYRLVYRYFHGEDIDLCNKKNVQRLKPLVCLLQDGFDSWEKIVNAMRTSAHDQNAEISLSTSPAFASKAEQMSECMINTVDTLQNAATLFVEYHNNLNRRECELEEISRKNAEQEIYIAELRSVIDARAQEMTDLKKKCDELQNAHHIFTETSFLQKQVIERQQKKIDEMQTAFRLMQETFAEDAPRDPLQTKNVSDADDVAAPEEMYMDTENIVRLQLPQLCLYCNKAFRYSSKFENEFQTLSRKYQESVVHSIMTLSEYGPEYSGLRTNKVLADYHNGRIKGGMMKSRIGRNYRFVWEIVDDVLYVVGLFHKNKIGG